MENEVQASVARCLRTPPQPARAEGFDFGTRTALSGLSNRSIVVVGNYNLARYDGTISGKSTPFTPSSILFRPQHRLQCSFAVCGGGAGYCPRVR